MMDEKNRNPVQLHGALNKAQLTLISSKRICNEKYLRYRFFFPTNNRLYFLEPFIINEPSWPLWCPWHLRRAVNSTSSRFINFLFFIIIIGEGQALFQLSRHLNRESRLAKGIESCMNTSSEAKGQTVELGRSQNGYVYKNPRSFL